MMRARAILQLAVLVSVGLVSVAPAAAEYPERAITLIVPNPAGSSPDIVGRSLAEAVRKHLPKPVAVVNRPGGAGTIGIAEVIQSKADGYTIGLSAVAIHTVHPHMTSLPFRTPDDYLPVMKLITQPVVLFVRRDAPWKTARELLDHARANPGRLRVGVPGMGTIHHLDFEQLKRLAGVDITTVPFEGPEQIAALLGGHVDVALAHPAPIVQHVSAGRLRVIGVFRERRSPLFPDAETFKELGYDVTLGVYNFLIAPKGTPPAVADTIQHAFRKALADPAFVSLMERSHVDIDYQNGAALTRELWASFEQNGKLVESLGLRKK